MARRIATAPTFELVEEIRKLGTAAWLDRQLAPDSIDDSRAEGYTARYWPWANKTVREVIAEDPKFAFRATAELSRALMTRMIFGQRYLRDATCEVLGDHLYAPVDGKSDGYVVELDKILRTRCFGRYADLLKAAIKHPALLIELDNHQSTKSAVNENLGRELLELYTVGVGNYPEGDVRQSALILTGHGVDRPSAAYRYRPENHHVGRVKVIGFSAENADAAGGERLLDDYLEYLAKHPGCAKRLARRFAVRFVSDQPSAALIDELAKVYLANDTRLEPMLRTLFGHREFRESVGHKWRRPAESMATMVRARGLTRFEPLGAHGSDSVFNSGPLGWALDAARHQPRGWAYVDGYPDTAGFWSNANATLVHWNHAMSFAAADDTEFNKPDWAARLAVRPGDSAQATARSISLRLTGYEWDQRDLDLLASMLLNGAKQPAGPADTLKAEDIKSWLVHGVRLVFASPYFMLR